MSSKMPKYTTHVPLPPLVLSSQNPNTLRAKTTSSPNKRHSCENFGSLIKAIKLQTLLHFTISSQILNVNQTKLYKL